MITRDKFFHSINNGGLPRKRVELASGEHVYVRPMTLGERNKMYALPTERRQSWVIMACTVYEDGNPFFVPEDEEAISKMPDYEVEPIWAAVIAFREVPEGNDETTAGTSS
jgi:hypothetical protein